MKKIFATNNPTKYAIVDDDIAEIIKEMNLKFYINNKGYFCSTTKIKLSGMAKKKQLYLHQFVYIIKTKTEPSSTVDHIDFNPANNMFENLRLASRKEQSQHRGRMKNNKSGYIGVSHYHAKRRGNNFNYWRAHIQRPDRKREQKYFPYTDDGLLEAAHWYDAKAIEYHGEFHGELNFPSHDN